MMTLEMLHSILVKIFDKIRYLNYDVDIEG